MVRPEIIEEPTEKKGHFWLILFFVFVGIFMFIFFTTFYEEGMDIPLTGNVIKDNETIGEISVNADLTIPANFPINSQMKTLGIKIKGPTVITIGNQEIHLNKSSSFVIENFDGKFIIEANTLLKLQGTADQVFLDGTPIREKKGNTKVSFEKIDYSYVEMQDITLNTLSYTATGILKINDGKFLVNLQKEEFYLNDFSGDLEINKNYLRIDGNVQNFDANRILKNK